MNKRIYIRKVKGGGINIKQLIFFRIVITLLKNNSQSNGDKHGWRLEIKKRNRTAL
jgi:hypothetical protein